MQRHLHPFGLLGLTLCVGMTTSCRKNSAAEEAADGVTTGTIAAGDQPDTSDGDAGDGGDGAYVPDSKLKPKPPANGGGDADAGDASSDDADADDAGSDGGTGGDGVDGADDDASGADDDADDDGSDDDDPMPQQRVWTFNDASDYVLDTAAIDVTAGSASLLTVDQTDDDDGALGFGGGSHADTAWETNHLALDAGGMTAGTGTYTSRVIDAGGDVAWHSLAWTPLAPYGKQLPDNGGVETAYANDNVSMSGNLALLHFNESSWGGAGSIADTSGAASPRPGTPSGNAAPAATGVFGGAAALDGNADFIDVAAPTIGATADLTYSIWVKFNAFDSAGGPNDGSGDYIIDRATATDSLFSFKLISGNRFGLQTRFANGSDLGVAQGGTVASGVWYHLVGVRDRTAALFRLYVNGVEVGTRADSGGSLTLPPPRLGSHATTFTNAVNGYLDEFAIFDRALGPTEVAAMYRRGVMNVRVQARTCDDDQCDGEDFVGPGNNPLVSYSEAGNSLLGLPNADLTGSVDNRYVQYQMTLTSRDPTLTPQIASAAFGPPHRYAGSPAITVVNGVSYTALTGFAAELTGDVSFQLSPDGLSWYYHDGNDWVLAADTSTATSAAQVDAALAGFAAAQGPGDFYVRAILNSSGGTAAAGIDSITLDFE